MQIDQYETLSVERDGHWILWFNQPEALNAITTQMVTELRHYFDHLYENDQARVVLWADEVAPFAPVWTSNRPAIPRCLGPSAPAWASKAIWPRSTSKCAVAPSQLSA